MDRFDSLSAFIAVVEQGGFAAGARRLGLSRSQVSKLVMALEGRLGVQLLNRTTRSVAATPAGRAYYERARTALQDLAEAETALQDDAAEPQGELKINAPMSFGTLHLGRAIADFMAAHPKIRVQLVLDDRFVDPVTDGFDITVRIGAPAQTLALVDHDIVEVKRLICASPGFLARHGEPRDPRALAELPCLHYGWAPAGASWRLHSEDGSPTDARVNPVLCSNNAEVLRDAAVAGLGLALLPTFIAGAELQTGRLVSVLNAWRAPEIRLCLLYAPSRHLSSRIRLFVEFFYARFGDRPYWDLVG